jgi:hypothetical protein
LGFDHSISGGSRILSYDRNAAGRTPLIIDNSTLKLFIGGNEKARLDSAGNVGIGTTSPAEKLHVVGNVQINDHDGTGNLQIGATDGAGNDAIIGMAARNSSNGISPKVELKTIYDSSGGANGSAFTISTRSGSGLTEKMRINPSGQIQFAEYGSGTFTGTATKNLAVDTNGNVIETDGSIIDGSGTTNYVSKWSDANTLTDSQIFDNGTNVGISTASPAYKLDVNGDGRISGVTFIASGATRKISTHSNAGQLQLNGGTDSSGGAYININGSSYSSGRMVLYSPESIYLNSDVGIGTTTPGEKLHVAGNIRVGNSTDTIYSNRFKGINNADVELRANNGYDLILNGSSGDNVGIGTTSPSFKTTIYSDSTTDSFPLVVGQPNAANEFVGIGLSGFVASNGAVKAGFVLDRKNTYGVGDIHILNNTTTDNSNATLADSKFTILQNNNVGIGTTSPSTKLEVAGAVGNFQTTGHQIFLTRNGNNEIYAVGASSVLALGTNSAEKMRITSTGNVGIGTTNPPYKLTVQGDAYVYGGNLHLPSSTYGIVNAANITQKISFPSLGNFAFENVNVGIGTTSPSAKLDITSTTGGQLRVGYNNLYGWNLEHEASTGAFTFKKETSEKVRFAQNGNVGIGTTSPVNKLDVAGNIGIDQYLLHNGDVNTFFGFPGNDAASIGTNGTERIRVTSTGAVGIGTTSPAKKLDVNGEIQGTNLYAETYRSSRSDGDIYIQATAATDFVAIGTQVSPNLMRIQGDGNVGIGTTSPGQKITIDQGVGNVNQGIPATSGSSQNGILRLQPGGPYGESFDFGMNVSTTYAWIQPTNKSNHSVNYNLSLNPNGGNVGIGTASPGEKLEVNGTIKTSTGLIKGANASAYINLDGAVGSRLRYGNQYLTANATNLVFSTNNNVRMIVTNAGDVGIGTTTPASKLDVNGGIRMADDSSTASASNVGTLRYRTSGNNSYVDMCMQTGASTYAWVNIVQNNW